MKEIAEFYVPIVDLKKPNMKEIGENSKITNRKEIKIVFEYPLTTPATLSFKNSNGFHLKDLLIAVHQGYTAIYKEEDSTAPVKESKINRGNMYNRPATKGKHGIWGHDLCDLCLHGFEEVKPGVFHLNIDS